MLSTRPMRWMLAFFCTSLFAVGCATTTDSPSGDTGDLSVQLVLADGFIINTVEWEITGNGMEMDGVINVSAPGSTASVEVFGLPPGEEDYTVTLTAESEGDSDDEKARCSGSADFNVRKGEVETVMVILRCKLPQRLGSVRVNGDFNVCAELVKATAAPLKTSVGNDITLTSEAVDAENEPITYSWTGTGGSFDDPTDPNPTYTCEEEGTHQITISVTDNDDYCDMATWTFTYIECEGDGGGTGGSGGAAGAGGAAGEGGAGGAAGEGGAGGAAGEGGAGGAAGEGGAGGAAGEGGAGGAGGQAGAGGDGGAGGQAGAGGDGGAGGAGGQASVDFPLTTLDINMCCNNNAQPQQSIIPISLEVDPGEAVAGGAFTASLSGTLVFPESFLDVANTVVPGGVQQADLVQAQVTVEPRGAGATGAPVAVPPIFPEGQCLIVGGTCDVANNIGGIDFGFPGFQGNTDCQIPSVLPPGPTNPCQRLVSTTNDFTQAGCNAADPPECSFDGSGFCSDGSNTACTVDGDCTAPATCAVDGPCVKTDQWNLNGFCAAGPLLIPLDTVVGNYTAGASGSQMLFGWTDDPALVPNATNSGTGADGSVTIGAPTYPTPLGASGLKVSAGGLAVAIECIMANETGDDTTDPVTCGTTPDADLIGAADGVPAGNNDYTIP